MGDGISEEKGKAREAISSLRQALDEKAPISQIESLLKELEEIIQNLETAPLDEDNNEEVDTEVIDAEFDEN